MRPRATIEDVAAAAGVSVATVSRALRGLPNVAPATREHVEQIAAGLSYRADPAASRLAAGRSHSIALAVPILNGWYFSQVVAGAEAVCSEAGYDMIVIGVTGDRERQALVDTEASLHRRVDGIVLVDIGVEQSELRTLREHGVRVVAVGAECDGVPSVGIDDVAVGDTATSHLIELGHRRIGLIAGEHESPLQFVVPGLRQRGFEAALERAGLRHDRTLRGNGHFSITGGHAAMAHLLSLEEPPTAIFAMSDEMAFGALLAAREADVDIPGDVSLIGVDDHELAVVVGLTTVRQLVTEQGARATRVLLDELGGAAADVAHVETPIELVVRTTTAPLVATAAS